jgi:hypothetical protein
MANYFMQGGDGKEYGPVSAEQLRLWVTEGRANAQTQVRLAEGGSYMSLGAVPELNAAGAARVSGYTPSAVQSAPSAAFAPSGPGSNYFMQGGDGKEYGPVSAEQLRQWVTEGRANAQTQVRLAESGSFLALGVVAELNGAGVAAGSRYASLAQNSGTVGTDSALVVKRLAAILEAGSGWMKFLAVVSIIPGAMMCFGPGIFIGWLPIWMGVVLWKAATKAQEAARTGLEAELIAALAQLRFYFKLLGIYLVVMVVAAVFAIGFFGVLATRFAR